MRNWDEDQISTTMSNSSKPETRSDTQDEAPNQQKPGLPRSPAMANLNLNDLEAGKEVPPSSDEGSVQRIFSAVATRKLVRKLDLHLLPMLCLIYMLCFLDRTNVGNARLEHMEEDLQMANLDYNVALAILFPFYVLSEVPATLVLKKVSPSRWFFVITFVWGVIMTMQGLVKTYTGLLVCRAFLGAAEGGLFPGVSFYLTMWYPRHETGLRLAMFFSAATAAGAFGGFLARVIAMMDGIGGLSAWSWIFILEGLLTVFASLLCPFLISNSHNRATFLTTEEKVEVNRRLTADGDFSDEFDWKYVVQAFTDWKVYANMLLTMGIFTSLYSISLFLPTILKDLGYSSNKSQLMTVPVYAWAFVCTIAGSYFADKSRQRGIFLLGFELSAIMGFAMLRGSDQANIQYAGTFFAAGGIYSLVPLIGVWNSNNLAGSTKRATGIGMQIAFGNLGGIIAGFIYLTKDAPRFKTGHTIQISLISFSFLITVFMTIWFRRENARRAKLLTLGNFTTEMLKAEEDEKGDKSVTFVYTV